MTLLKHHLITAIQLLMEKKPRQQILHLNEKNCYIVILFLLFNCNKKNENFVMFSNPFYRIYRYDSDSLMCIAKNSDSLYYSIKWNENNTLKIIKTSHRYNQGLSITFSDSIDYHKLRFIENTTQCSSSSVAKPRS